jgi:hypothetical protein
VQVVQREREGYPSFRCGDQQRARAPGNKFLSDNLLLTTARLYTVYEIGLALCVSSKGHSSDSESSALMRNGRAPFGVQAVALPRMGTTRL